MERSFARPAGHAALALAMHLIMSVIAPSDCDGQESCLDRVLSIIERTRAADQKALSADLTIISVPGLADAVPDTSHLTISQQAGRSLVIRDHLSNYDDGSTVLVVDRHERSVMVYDKPFAPPAFPNTTPLSLIRMAQVSECRRTTTGRSDRLEVLLDMPSEPAYGAVEHVRFIVDLLTGSMLSTEVDYGPGHRLKRYTVHYDNIRAGVTDPRLTASSLQNVIRNGKLQSPYSDYSLHDRRKSRKP